MFIAGKLFETPEEAKKWVEGQTTENERRHWIILMLDPADPSTRPPSQGILLGSNDGSGALPHTHHFVNDVCACGARDD